MNNHILLQGVLTRDPELRYTPSGLAIFEGTISGEHTTPDGKTIPFYHVFSMLGASAEIAAEHELKAGDGLFLEAAFDYQSWEKEGQKQSALKIKGLRFEPVLVTEEVVTDSGGGKRLSGGQNLAIITGNLAADAEVRYTPDNTAVLDLNVAINETWGHGDKRQKKTHWVTVTLWRKLAEQAQELKKGQRIIVRGYVNNESWSNKEGQKRSATKLVAEHLNVSSRKKAAESN
ncbi:single-stranded DNA-binding protein [Deinococcus sp. Marseille-Q6407]|uniref:single-stranded DNA-binding protein n=1 Tax=Deinococcus sp. Marseille-Q6407 TaxID=2969223 RepID=UPI0021BFA675|nr:single-stranded DNA-binding protein [Deinococcus sp. Marseille-Q6407]